MPAHDGCHFGRRVSCKCLAAESFVLSNDKTDSTGWKKDYPNHDVGMQLVLIVLLLLILFGGGGFYWGGPAWGGGGLGLVLLIVLIIFLMGGFRGKV